MCVSVVFGENLRLGNQSIPTQAGINPYDGWL